jgi:hypothetical protein
MSTQARLRATPCYAAEGPEDTGCAENSHPCRSGGNTWRETVEDHGDVVEDVCCQSVGFAFGLEGGADAVCEADCCNAARYILEDM